MWDTGDLWRGEPSLGCACWSSGWQRVQGHRLCPAHLALSTGCALHIWHWALCCDLHIWHWALCCALHIWHQTLPWAVPCTSDTEHLLPCTSGTEHLAVPSTSGTEPHPWCHTTGTTLPGLVWTHTSNLFVGSPPSQAWLTNQRGLHVITTMENLGLKEIFPFLWLPQLISTGFLLLLCLESAVVSVFLLVPSVLSRVCAPLHLPWCRTASAFHFSNFYPFVLPSVQLKRKSRAFKSPPKHRISAHPWPLPTGFYSTFSSSSEAGLYVHIFDLRGIIAATRVNNAVLNYKSEYLKMKPALSHSLLPNGNACDLWPSDKGILMDKRCI